jgi:hypothetical protein
MPEIFFFAIVFYLVYRLVVDLVVPVFRTSVRVKQQFGDMRNRYSGNGQQNANPGESGAPKNAGATAKKQNRAGEYIDFEEVK